MTVVQLKPCALIGCPARRPPVRARRATVGSCMTAENMAHRREYRRNHRHPESSESRKNSNRKYRISSYGLTQEQFDRLLDAQQHTCGMCHEPFGEGNSSTWTIITRAAGGRTDRAESASGDSCAIPATSR